MNTVQQQQATFSLNGRNFFKTEYIQYFIHFFFLCAIYYAITPHTYINMHTQNAII